MSSLVLDPNAIEIEDTLFVVSAAIFTSLLTEGILLLILINPINRFILALDL